MRFTPRFTLPGGLGLGLILVLGLAGCSGDVVKPYEPTTDPAQLYLQLALNLGAANLSLVPSYNTIQLTATPLNALGEPMAGLPAPTFRSTDTMKVTVSPTGLVTALNAGTGIFVIAELTTSDNVKHVDTAFINVNNTTDPPPELATLTIDPVPPDSTIWPVAATTGGTGAVDLYISSFWTRLLFGRALQLRNYLKALTAGGTAIPSLQVEYFSLDTTVASVNRRTGAVTRKVGGPARLVVRTAAYGVIKADTTVFTLTPPIYQMVMIGEGPAGKAFESVVIREGGYVYWTNRWRPVDMVFDNPSAVGITPADTACKIATVDSPRACDMDMAMDTTTTDQFPLANGYRIRRFLTPGTYTYRDTLSGEVGQVIVQDSTAWGR